MIWFHGMRPWLNAEKFKRRLVNDFRKIEKKAKKAKPVKSVSGKRAIKVYTSECGIVAFTSRGARGGGGVKRKFKGHKDRQAAGDAHMFQPPGAALSPPFRRGAAINSAIPLQCSVETPMQVLRSHGLFVPFAMVCCFLQKLISCCLGSIRADYGSQPASHWLATANQRARHIVLSAEYLLRQAKFKQRLTVK